MKKVIRLTESGLSRVIKRIMRENEDEMMRRLKNVTFKKEVKQPEREQKNIIKFDVYDDDSGKYHSKSFNVDNIYEDQNVDDEYITFEVMLSDIGKNPEKHMALIVYDGGFEMNMFDPTYEVYEIGMYPSTKEDFDKLISLVQKVTQADLS